jgi:hypothetical protein
MQDICRWFRARGKRFALKKRFALRGPRGWTGNPSWSFAANIWGFSSMQCITLTMRSRWIDVVCELCRCRASVGQGLGYGCCGHMMELERWKCLVIAGVLQASAGEAHRDDSEGHALPSLAHQEAGSRWCPENPLQIVQNTALSHTQSHKTGNGGVPGSAV